MFSYTCHNGIVVALRHTTAAELQVLNHHITTSIENHTGVALTEDLFHSDRGIFAFPQWHLCPPGEKFRQSTLTEVLDILPASQQTPAFLAHINVMRDVEDHLDRALNGEPVCGSCLTNTEAEHIAELDEAFVAYSLELSATALSRTSALPFIAE